MKEFIVNNLDTVVTVLKFCLNKLDVFVTILGFVITYKLTTRTFGNEIKKSKIDQNVEAMHSLPLELCNMMSKIQKSQGNKKKVSTDEYENLMTRIFAYGSKDAVALAVEIQQTFYKVAKTNEDCGQYLLVLFALLITQLKYEISDEIISPESWFKLTINDYATARDSIVEEINSTIRTLDLNKKFYVRK